MSTADLSRLQAEPFTTARTGIAGLDDVLSGGLSANRLFLIEGVPGSGKTTLAMQFLLEGVRLGERVLYFTLSESIDELRAVAVSHGWSLDGIDICDLAPSAESLHRDGHYTMFHPSEVELGETIEAILAEVERIKPSRVAIDSLSELRMLAGTALRYRRQVLALKQFFTDRKCTVLILDDMTAVEHDLQVQSIAHGVLLLEQSQPEYGTERRRVRVVKYRGVRYRGGLHDYVIRRGGLVVFPRLVANEHPGQPSMEKLASGVVELDTLLGGGIERGTSTLIAGAAGTGKSTLAAQFVFSAAERGERSLMLAFDEGLNTLLTRSASLGIDLRRHIASGRIVVRQVDPAELSPGEMTHVMRDAVEKQGCAVVVIDSLNGCLNAMPGERLLIVQLHELLAYLGQAGVASVLISAHSGLIGSDMSAAVDASYLADAVLLMRYFETAGEVRLAISVVKKRGSDHERTIREFSLSGGRIRVGPPLRGFRGILTGVPVEEDGQKARKESAV